MYLHHYTSSCPCERELIADVTLGFPDIDGVGLLCCSNLGTVRFCNIMLGGLYPLISVAAMTDTATIVWHTPNRCGHTKVMWMQQFCAHCTCNVVADTKLVPQVGRSGKNCMQRHVVREWVL